jgi:hypothetical protein
MPVSYNEYIPKPNFDVEFTSEQIEEIVKCKNDFFYFCKYVKIVHPDFGRIIFVPRNYQIEIAKSVIENRYTLARCCRQSGKTQLLSVLIIWFSIFNDDKFIGIASNKAASAKDFLARVKLIYEELPVWLKPAVVEYNKTSLQFDNGTRIESSSTTKDTFRGRTIWLLCLDEFAHVPESYSEAFWNSNYHALSASTESRIVILSTPNGMFNLFWRLDTDADARRNSFNNFVVTWERVPGRDEIWKQNQLEHMTMDQFRQEQECAYIGSVSTVINHRVLEHIIKNYTYHIERGLAGHLLIYEKPALDSKYVIGVDVAKGTGHDYSAIQVLKIMSVKPIRLEQVAVYNSNRIDVYDFSDVIVRLGLYYNNAILMIENNAEGISVVNKIWWDLEYQNLYSSDGKDLGIRSTRQTKPRAVLLMKKLIEDYSLKIVDKTTLEQLADFSERNKKFTCLTLNDDLISALYWACYFITTDWLDENFEFKKNKKDDNDAWGILSDVNTQNVDWSWVSQRGFIL